jgi:hypothetical protein
MLKYNIYYNDSILVENSCYLSPQQNTILSHLHRVPFWFSDINDV